MARSVMSFKANAIEKVRLFEEVQARTRDLTRSVGGSRRSARSARR
jgi:hypothetical protein